MLFYDKEAVLKSIRIRQSHYDFGEYNSIRKYYPLTKAIMQQTFAI